MIALLLAAQLSAAAPQAQPFAIAPAARGDFIQLRQRPKASNCLGSIGQMEVSFAQPAALYRKGDRPARGFRKWADYPEPMLCAVEAGR
jgi:hypothetical protein